MDEKCKWERFLTLCIAALLAALLAVSVFGLLVACKSYAPLPVGEVIPLPVVEEPVARTYQCLWYVEQGCAKAVAADGGEVEFQSGSTLDVQTGATFNVDGTLSSSSGELTVSDDVTITGYLSVTTGIKVSGDVTLQNGEVISNSTDGDVFVNGELLFRTNVISKSADYTLQGCETGSFVVNMGTAGMTYTLPSATVGLNYCFYITSTNVITIAPGASDQILVLSNAAGDRVNASEEGGVDALCLTAISDELWAATAITGTWTDTN